jgi:cytochrome c peroxidase
MLSNEELLGKRLFFDTNLSHPTGQSCGSCHAPQNAFTDPDQNHATSEGVNPGLFGNRNTPTASYAAFSPDFHFDATEGLWVGGQFLDGRSATLEHQAQQPFLNPNEMANIDRAQVVNKVKNGSNAGLFQQVYGPNAFADVDAAYVNISNAIAAFERTPEVSPFSSRFDYFLRGKVNLTQKEQRGLNVFNDPNKGNCAACHISESPDGGATPPLFTDFTYDNIGIPTNFDSGWLTNPNNPDGVNAIDLGLGAVVGDPDLDGAFKVSTLRNLELTAPYGHNGYFTSIEQIVDFYATRDVKPVCSDPATPAADALLLGCWPAAEVPHTMNLDELGNLPLTAQDKEDMVDFLKTLTDGYDVKTQVPVPASAGLLVAGLASFVWLRRRKRAFIV